MNKHPKRKPNRLKEYNYKQPGYYFVTVCSKDSKSIFGECKNDQMQLNDVGQMVHQVLRTFTEYYPGIIIDDYVVMPNHVHAIIEIKENDVMNNVRRGGSPWPPAENGQNHILYNGPAQGPAPTTKRLSLSDIMYQFKSLTTKKYIDEINNNDWQPLYKSLWQRSFHDHIIHTDTSLQNIREYIINNPSTWNQDEYNINKKIDKGKLN